MAYEKLNLEDGQVLNATHLKHMEDGIAAAGLPDVTTSDNGKILQVSGGKWTAVTVPVAEEASV